MRLLQRMRGSNPDTLILVLLIAIALTRGTLYALVTPPFDSPDEKGHYDYVASLYETQGTAMQGKERHQPSLYYWITLPAYALFAHQPPDLEVYALATGKPSLLSLIAVRLMSVLMTVATIPLAYWTAKTVRPKDRFIYLGTAAFVALEPAYGWLGASVNNDNLANLLAAGMILMLLRCVSNGFSRGYVVGLVGLTAVAMVTKLTTWPSAAIVAAVLAVRAITPRHARGLRLTAAAAALLLAVATIFLVGPIRSLAASFFKPWTEPGLLSPHRLSTFFSNLDVWPFVYEFKTFWGSFSADSVQLPPVVYWILAVLTAASATGLLARLARALRKLSRDGVFQVLGGQFGAQVLVLISIALVEIIVPLGRYYGNSPLRADQRIAGWEDDFALLQGRFLFPAMVPLGFLFVWGLEALLPSRWSKHGTWVLIGLLIAIDWTALLVLAYGGHSWQVYPGQG